MVRLTNEEWLEVQKPLSEPADTATEYGHRGIITSRALYNQQTQVEADEWVVSAPVDATVETR